MHNKTALRSACDAWRTPTHGKDRHCSHPVVAPILTSALIGGLKGRGCFTEIDWKLHAFVPLHEERAKIIETILEVLPILAE